MRLDKYICEATQLSRSLAKRVLLRGEVCVDGVIIKDAAFKLPADADVRLSGEPIVLLGLRYLMLNKAVHTLCSTVDEIYPSILSAIQLPKKERLHIAGRLDQDSTGLVLITDDGQWSHRVTSPNYRCDKCYRVQLAEPLKVELIERFAQGVQLKSESRPTLPAKLDILSEFEARITLCEGKYHQVKRMFAACGNRVTALHRESVGAIELDSALAPGQSRFLTQEEIDSI